MPSATKAKGVAKTIAKTIAKTTLAKKMTKGEARSRLFAAANAKTTTSEKADEAMSKFKALVLDAWAAGLTYEEVAEIGGLSRPRVDQIIREERIRRGIPINTKPGNTKPGNTKPANGKPKK